MANAGDLCRTEDTYRHASPRHFPMLPEGDLCLPSAFAFGMPRKVVKNKSVLGLNNRRMPRLLRFANVQAGKTTQRCSRRSMASRGTTKMLLARFTVLNGPTERRCLFSLGVCQRRTTRAERETRDGTGDVLTSGTRRSVPGPRC